MHPDSSPAELALTARWEPLVAMANAPAHAIEGLLKRHREPQRHYHTAEHVLAVLEHLDWLHPGDDPALRLAAFYHDAIYDTMPEPGQSSNEELSAQLASTELVDCDRSVVESVVALVRATEGHHLVGIQGAEFFLDADLSILGSPETRYNAYAAQIREEYRHVPDDQFRAGRRSILEGLLDKPKLYFSEDGRRRWEEGARWNIARELTLLAG